MELLKNIIGFNWDEGNSDKNWIKHRVLNKECEEIFFNEPVIIVNDEKHSKEENRYLCFGKTNTNRYLTVIFTIRDNLIRIISARVQNRKERIIMKKLKKIPKFKNEDEERKFWSKADTSDYFDWSKSKKYKFPNLKPSVSTISIRLPKGLLEDLKIQANEKDVPYQSLMKIYLAEKVNGAKLKSIRN